MSSYAIYDSPFGTIKIGYNEDAITELTVIKPNDLQDMGSPTSISDRAKVQLDEYFAGKRTTFDLPLRPVGTVFQKKVWSALCDIPYGQTMSYKEIAIAVGNERACRAVGMANNKNPIAIIIPCHRVIGSNGDLVGYAGGLDMKRSLLELESNKS